MAESLLETKLKEAVERTRGDVQAAVRLLAAWAEKDEKLLRALVQPFLQGILFHLVERTVKQAGGDPVAPRAAEAAAKPAPAAAKPAAASATGTKPNQSQVTAAKPAAKSAAKAAAKAAAPPVKPGELPPAVLDALVERWGAKIPVATKPDLGRPPRTVEEVLEGLGQGEPPPPGKASGRHQSGMRLIAKVQRMKRAKMG